MPSAVWRFPHFLPRLIRLAVDSQVIGCSGRLARALWDEGHGRGLTRMLKCSSQCPKAIFFSGCHLFPSFLSLCSSPTPSGGAEEGKEPQRYGEEASYSRLFLRNCEVKFEKTRHFHVSDSRFKKERKEGRR